LDVTPLEDALAYVRKHVDMFFRTGRQSAHECSTSLLSNALVLGAREASIVRDGALWIVGADVDWLANRSVAIAELFSRLVPLPEAGANSVRAEIAVGAFATDIAVVDAEGVVSIRGAVNESSVLALLKPRGWARAVAFTLPDP
jgi:hypothetical protein